jgi:hypothetical protein
MPAKTQHKHANRNEGVGVTASVRIKVSVAMMAPVGTKASEVSVRNK